MMTFLDNMKPICFWPYTSVVCDRILEIEYKHGDSVHQLHMELLAQFKEAGIKCEMDNKTVFEFMNTDNDAPHNMVYVGFYDNKMSVGYSWRTDNHNLTTARTEDRLTRILENQ